MDGGASQREEWGRRYSHQLSAAHTHRVPGGTDARVPFSALLAPEELQLSHVRATMFSTSRGLRISLRKEGGCLDDRFVSILHGAAIFYLQHLECCYKILLFSQLLKTVQVNKQGKSDWAV